MWIDYYLARHDDKTIFDLGKGGHFLIGDPMSSLIYPGWAYGKLRIPENIAELRAIFFRWWLEDIRELPSAADLQYVTLGAAVTFVAFVDIEYAELVVQKLWAFIEGGQNFSCEGDTGDQPSDWVKGGYRFISSRSYLTDPMKYAQYLERLNQIYAPGQ